MRHPLRDAVSVKALERPVDRIYPAPGIHWVGDGFRVMGFSSAYPELAQKLDPFLLMDYNPPHTFAPTNKRRGVGTHPHRGFETITLAFEGSVKHQDSAGGGGVIGPGDVQWMTAAAGILHEEFHEENFARKGGVFHMAQLWVNLPKVHKMSPPGYQGIQAAQMGLVALPNDAGMVRVVAGAYAGVKGPAKTFSPLTMLDISLKPDAEAVFTIPASENVAILVMKGAIAINNGPTAQTNELVVFANEGENIKVQALGETHLLLIGGEPINEPIVQYGPFVMNTEGEIETAIADFNAGRFGRMA
jgi:redox-sensitive bicupin YhaK (pirin superfamily)